MERPPPKSDDDFVRVLDPADPWLTPSAAFESRQANFRGKQDWDISVAKESRCDGTRVLAALHGARRDVVLDRPAYFRFGRSEAVEVGGDLHDTDANPPWPEDYNEAHHDIVSARDEVAKHMAQLHESDGARVHVEPEIDVLLLIAGLLSRPDVHKKFKKGATYRFRRMFTDGGAERDRWKQVAKVHNVLLEPSTVKAEFRKMYQDKSTRPQWTALLDELGVPPEARKDFR